MPFWLLYEMQPKFYELQLYVLPLERHSVNPLSLFMRHCLHEAHGMKRDMF